MTYTIHENICIIPAKGYSERLPDKNIKPLGGKPLLAHTVQCAQASELFDEIAVSTESDDVANVAAKYGANVPYRRPVSLAGNDKGVADVCIDLLLHYEQHARCRFKTTYILLPTSPFRGPQHLRDAADRFHSRPGTKVLMSVSELEYPPYWAMIERPNGTVGRMFPPEQSARRRHDLPKTYKPDGLVVILNTDAFLTHGSYDFPEILPYFTPLEASLDIDSPQDLAFAEFLLEATS